MGPIERMVAEHRVIESVLDALAAYGAAIGRGEAVDRERLGGFVTFIRGYADAIHHGKEEQIVFAALRRHGVPPALAPRLSAILRDHETARLLTTDMDSIDKRAGPWSEKDRAELVRAVRDYVSLLRRHIRDEDKAVFPQTAAALPDKVMHKVAAACERFDADHAGACADLEALAGRLGAEV